MLTTTCPWCEEDAALAMDELRQAEPVITCAACGTTVAFVAEEPEALELAA